MRLKDLTELPKVRDKISYLYLEHCRIDRDSSAIAVHDQQGVTPVPCAALNLLMLGPGTNISHAAITVLADNGCLVAWCGEQGIRFYAAGLGETRHSRNLMRQALLFSHPRSRLEVVRRLYGMRFDEVLDERLTIEQIRGKEGARVRDAYAEASRRTGVPWVGRSYDRGNWGATDKVNRALSAANSCLYGVCHAAIIASGYSTALGFIHIGKQLSFVYDVADLYKVELTVPLSFEVSAVIESNLERAVRLACRDRFHQAGLLKRVVDDIQHVLDVSPIIADGDDQLFDLDAAAPGSLWDPLQGQVDGGKSYSADPD